MATAAIGTVRYAEVFCDWLQELGYTHCYFVAGGNIMHLLDGARKRFTCIAVVHEVAAGIAAEYYNECGGPGRAFALVTAGPGITNIVTAIAGAWLESRELLVVGGQVKSSDLAVSGIRQRGIQEIDGRTIVSSITVASVRLEHPWSKRDVVETVLRGRRGRPAPVFLELCLDAQGAPVSAEALEDDALSLWTGSGSDAVATSSAALDEVTAVLRRALRPVLLIGGGVSRETADSVRDELARIGMPVMTTWNGADRVAADEPYYAGRPNTWGQRAANIILHQADCVIALGTRLGLQQTGFNWRQFGSHATVVQVDIDRAELAKGHPRIDLPIAGDGDTMLRGLAERDYPDQRVWREFCSETRKLLPVDEPWNVTRLGFISPFAFYRQLSAISRPSDVLIPCSSGGANSTAMQAIEQKRGQIIVTDKGLASMGYGLAGSIGAAMAHRDRRTILIEGDGGFSQNLQELATVRVNELNLKIFVFANEGYASIRMTQKNYFGGAYVGCDIQSGLGFPEWPALFAAFGIPVVELEPERGLEAPDFRAAFDAIGARAFIVPIDPEQTYFPKIVSHVTASGSMESNPLHLMSPDLPPEIEALVFRFVPPREAT